MGCYVNPQDMSKEEWLLRNGVEVWEVPEWAHVPENWLPVCLVNNGPFNAAGVAYSEDEFTEFKRPDTRVKRWYLVQKEKLRTVCPLDKYTGAAP